MKITSNQTRIPHAAEGAAVVRIGQRDERVWQHKGRLCYVVERDNQGIQRGFRDIATVTICYLDNGRQKSLSQRRFQQESVLPPVPTAADLREAVHSWLDRDAAKDDETRMRLVLAACRNVSDVIAQKLAFAGHGEPQIRNHVAIWQDAKRQENTLTGD